MHDVREGAEAASVTTAEAAVAPAGAKSPGLRLVDAPAGALVQLASGRIVVAMGIVIQGACFVRPLLGCVNERPASGRSDQPRLGSMEVLNGDQLVAVANGVAGC